MALDSVPLPNAAPAAPIAAASPADSASAQPPQEAAPATNAFPSPFADVIAGSIPAVSVPGIEKNSPPDPVQSFVVASLDKLTQAGLDFYEGKDHVTVLFNPAKITQDALEKADKAGDLASIAPPASAAAAAPQGGLAAHAQDTPQGEAQGAAPDALATAPAPGAKPSPALTRGRLANIGAVKSNGIKPNPLPSALARRPV